jgi:hypothetical protein
VCGLGRGAECAGGTEFRTAFRDTSAGNGDSAGAHGYAPGQYGDPAGQYSHATGGNSSGNGDSADAAARDVSKHDAAGHRSGIELAGDAYSRKQHTAVYGKSEYAKHAGDDSQRFALRTVAGFGWDAEFFDTWYGNAGVVKFRVFEFSTFYERQ